MPTTTLNADLLAGEVLTLVGPGKVEFQAVQAAKTAKVAAVAAKGGGVAAQGAATQANGSMVLTAVGKGAVPGTAMSTAAAKGAGTIWTGKGLSLGLGLGLGAWGPGLLAAAVVGGYIYYRKRQTMRIWPF